MNHLKSILYVVKIMHRSLLFETNENDNNPSLPPDASQLIQQVQCEFDDNLNDYAQSIHLILSTLKELEKDFENNEEYELQERAHVLIEFTNGLANDLDYMHQKDFMQNYMEYCKKIKNNKSIPSIPEFRIYQQFKNKINLLPKEVIDLVEESKINDANANAITMLSTSHAKRVRKQFNELDNLTQIIYENITDVKVREETLNIVFFLKKQTRKAKKYSSDSKIQAFIISFYIPKITELVFSFKKMTDESKTANRSSPEWKDKVNQFIAEAEDFKKFGRQTMGYLTKRQGIFIIACMGIGMVLGAMVGSLISPLAGTITGLAVGSIGGFALGYYLVNNVSFFRTHKQNTLSRGPTLMQKSFSLSMNLKGLR